jgi:hypothetical protein
MDTKMTHIARATGSDGARTSHRVPGALPGTIQPPTASYVAAARDGVAARSRAEVNL